jgi:hypothetical protein
MNAKVYDINIHVEIREDGQERIIISGPNDEAGLLLLRTLAAAQLQVLRGYKPVTLQKTSQPPQSPMPDFNHDIDLDSN